MASIIITADPVTKHISIQTDPPELVHDRVTCYGLLEIARDAIKDVADGQREERRRVQPVPSLRAVGLPDANGG